MFLLIEHIGLPVVTSTAETSTRRDFKSAWKGCPPELRVRQHAPSLHEKNALCAFFSCYHYRMPLLLTFFFSSLVTVAVIHITALQFFLYWKYLWLDIPVHFLGGISVVLGVSILPFFRIKVGPRYRTLLATLCIVLCVGLMWEIFEVFAGVPIEREGFVFDTTIDLLMDMLGGVIGYGIVKGITPLT